MKEGCLPTNRAVFFVHSVLYFKQTTKDFRFYVLNNIVIINSSVKYLYCLKLC